MNKISTILLILLLIVSIALIVSMHNVVALQEKCANATMRLKRLSENYIVYSDSLYDKQNEQMYYVHKNIYPRVWYITSNEYDRAKAKTILNACESFSDIKRIQFMVDHCGVTIDGLAHYINEDCNIETELFDDMPEDKQEHLPICILYYIAKKYGYWGGTGYNDTSSDKEIYNTISMKYYE